jgi:methionine aminotransferase
MNVKSKLPRTETSIFAVMSGLAQEYGAINLSQGFPDFPVSRDLIALVNKYMLEEKNQYAPMPGVPQLRESISQKINYSYHKKINPETEITITAGATQALFTAITAFVNKGDEVIIFEPAYDSYVPSIKINGGIPVFIELTKPDFSINWAEVKDKISDKTRMIIINSPNNPGGYILKKEDMEKLQQITADTNIIVLSDEVYEHIIFDGYTHQSIIKFEELYQRSLAVYSFGKTFHATGWKTGYVIAPPLLTSEFRKVHQFNVFSVNTPIQYALADYLRDPKNYTSLPDFYQQKRDFFLQAIKGSKFKIIPSHGTYFQVLDYSEISDQPEFDFAVWMTKEKGLASIPVSSFYHNKRNQQLLRFAFPKQEKTLLKAAEIIKNI